MATDYTATCYGVGGDNKFTDRTTAALTRNRDPKKGQKCVRFAIAAETEIMGGEIWVNADTAIIATDTFTITATATT
jgi:hypothetical protein